MKKILFATTALIATAGIASAEVALTGWAEMGIMGGEGGVDASNDQFVTRVDVNFSMSGESDNGITFGASVDLDETDGATSNAFVENSQGGETIFISGDFGTLTMGDTDGALDKAVAETDLMGDIDDSSTGFSVKGMAFMDGLQDNQVARFDYSVAGFGLSVSAETPNAGDDRATFGLGATYTVALGGADLDLGLGYQGGEDAEGWGLSAGTTVAGVSLVANYAEGIANAAGSADVVTKYYNIAATYSVDALTVGANYGEQHVDGVSTLKGFGLAAEYDLGGGLKVLAGYGESGDDVVGVLDDAASSYSLGLKMAF
ncbi:MAG: porin [Pseudomonadota bacterium]|nr:porin [Pseudomonadota bacterium]MEE3072004.1 porin [Pseudomonadota bacterium]